MKYKKKNSLKISQISLIILIKRIVFYFSSSHNSLEKKCLKNLLTFMNL